MSGFYLSVVFDLPVKQSFTYLPPPPKPAKKSRRLAKNTPQPLPSPSQAQAECNSPELHSAGSFFGKRVAAPFGKRELTGFVIGETSSLPGGLDPSRLKAALRVVDSEPLFDAADLELARWTADYYFCSLGEALQAMLPTGRRAGESASLAAAAMDSENSIKPSSLTLSSEQEAALSAITSVWSGESQMSSPWFYLYGITGSGKTEVFLRAAEAALKAGRDVIYLVPEIALTRQTAEAVQARFGALAATVHSAMTGSERLAVHRRIRAGEVRIVVGPRSAVFAPLRNLGLIIIDEEHDGSYKSGNTPRYHARQAAMHISKTRGALLVMGSATPSVEAWRLMKEGGIRRLGLSTRLAGGKPPDISVVSLAGVDGCLSPQLRQAIRETALAGRQTILFLNRRGFAYYYHCPQCGFELKCRHCSVSLTWHKAKNRAVCHYCGYQSPPPRVCPNCGSLEAGFSGFGTEMIEEEVRRVFPDLRVSRIDADTAARKGALEEALAAFRRREVDILLGTQMVAKGLNFPGVSLVGVVFADSSLQLPDFRAAERTFALIVQVAGRAGRFFPDGKVLVQTLRPADAAISHACALESEAFYEGELEQRKAQRFPPYTRLLRFVLRSKTASLADEAALRLASHLADLLPAGAEILGPAECPISLLSGSHRRHILLRAPSMRPIHNAAREALAKIETNPKVYIEIDVDPVSVL